MFKLIVTLLATGKFPKGSTQHLLLECAINSARNDSDINIVKNWYAEETMTDLEGNKVDGIEISNKHKHLMLRRIYSSNIIPHEEKE